ncbi:MAG: Tim44/TimA family putative adaptor protein [Candidatus Puniceispirillaceae bacterium]
MPLIDILIFAAIALFLIFRLRSILGSRDGFEQRREEVSRFSSDPANDANPQDEKVISLHVDKKPINGKGLTAVRQADSSFRDDEFMTGAASAFSMVLSAFADCDLASLRRLLAFELYQEFAQSVHDRNKRGDRLEITIDEIEDVQLLDGEVIDNVASVTVQFVSLQTRLVTDKHGVVLEDESESKVKITDIWVFERDTTLADPNWKLVETRVEDDN